MQSHRSSLPFLADVRGPDSFFFYNLFQSERTGAPLSWRNRAAGSIDAYAAAVGRWLVTRDGFDFLVYYLSDYDYASHEHGPDAAFETLARCDDAVGSLADAAGGLDELLDRYALVVLSDHGQTRVQDVAVLERPFAGVDDVLVTASNRAAQVYALDGCVLDPRQLAAALDQEPSVDVTLFREGRDAVARRQGDELRFAPGPGGWTLSGDAGILHHPDALERAWRALANPNAGEVLVSAAAGWEFADLGGGTTSGAARTGHCSRGTRRCRFSRSASTERRGASSTSPRSCSRTSPSGSRRTRSAVPPEARGSGSAGAARAAMVEHQLRRRGITDERVLAAMGCVPRELFVPRKLRDAAYEDTALPIGHDQTISQPYIVAATCALLGLSGGERVLDVGTGSGYAACVLAELAAEVVTIERMPALAAAAAVALAEAGHPEVDVRVGDGSLGVPDRAPYDAVAVAAAAPSIPPALVAQLAEGGRLVVPRGTRHAQRLVLVERRAGKLVERASISCRFVPLLGAAGFAE